MLVSGAGLEYASLSDIPFSITVQGNNTGSIEPGCRKKIIEEVSPWLVMHFPVTSSSKPMQYSSPNLISPSYAIN